MTISLFGAALCSSLYLLEKFTTFDIFEAETTFRKSPNAISKIATILPFRNEATFDTTKDDIIMRSMEKKNAENQSNDDNIANTNAMLLLTEVVEEATKTRRMQQQNSFDEQ